MADIEYLPESSDTPSPFSVVSFVIGALLAVGAIGIVLIDSLSDLGAGGAATPAAWRIGLWSSMVMSIAGIALGILGVASDRPKALGFGAIALNGLIFLSIGLLVGLGRLAL